MSFVFLPPWSMDGLWSVGTWTRCSSDSSLGFVPSLAFPVPGNKLNLGHRTLRSQRRSRKFPDSLWWSPPAGRRRCLRGRWAVRAAAPPERSPPTRCRCWPCSPWRRIWARGRDNTVSRCTTRWARRGPAAWRWRRRRKSQENGADQWTRWKSQHVTANLNVWVNLNIWTFWRFSPSCGWKHLLHFNDVC